MQLRSQTIGRLGIENGRNNIHGPWFPKPFYKIKLNYWELKVITK